MRKMLGIADETVYGHVGRFVPVKNHPFLLGVFEKILQKDEKAVLLLLGDGDQIDHIKELAQKKGIAQKVRFMGHKDNVADFMNTMDIFLLPSFHEGFGIVAVEAQAAGLPCLLADTITREVEITDRVRFLPLGDSDIWAKYALEMRHYPRLNTQEAIREVGYDIETSTRILEKFYCAEGGCA